jgi:2,4-dienoyl-CoA reductase-like NADH-dependent reductase (Old Yellow Enzyme family)
MRVHNFGVGSIHSPSVVDHSDKITIFSAVAGHVSLVRPERAFVTPRAPETREVYEVVEQFRAAAQKAQRAGFESVQ